MLGACGSAGCEAFVVGACGLAGCEASVSGWDAGAQPGRVRPVAWTSAQPSLTTQTTGVERKLPLPGSRVIRPLEPLYLVSFCRYDTRPSSLSMPSTNMRTES